MKHKYNEEAFLREMKRRQMPENFRLEASPIGIDIGDRTYGILCECGSKNFSEDNVFGRIFCSECEKQLAIRSVEVGWVDEGGQYVK